MDNQVFLVSRMHEEWIHTKDNHRAVTICQAETGGIITAAGIIAVFGGFALGQPNSYSTPSSSEQWSSRRSCTDSAHPTGGTQPGSTRSPPRVSIEPPEETVQNHRRPTHPRKNLHEHPDQGREESPTTSRHAA